MKKDYVIMLPTFSVRNGLKISHLLYDELEKRGYNVYLYSEDADCEINPEYKYIEKSSKDIREHGIVIYPEVYSGNPHRSQNVIRYVLYYPGVNRRFKKIDDSDTLFSYRNELDKDDPILTIPYIDEALFYDDYSEKSQDCCFISKIGNFYKVKETEGLLEITPDYPKSKEELATLLRQTRVLYSYDENSSILDEAVLCGAKVKIVTKAGIKTYHSKYKQLTIHLARRINYFIEITQNLSSDGKTKGVGLTGEFIYFYNQVNFFLNQYIFKNRVGVTKYWNKLRGV